MLRFCFALTLFVALSGCDLFRTDTTDDTVETLPPLRFASVEAPPRSSSVSVVHVGRDGGVYAVSSEGVYARSRDAEVFRSLGESDAQEPLYETQAGELFIGIDKGGIRRSVDDGRTWDRIADPFRVGDGVDRDFCSTFFVGSPVLDVRDLLEVNGVLVAATRCGVVVRERGTWRATRVRRQSAVRLLRTDGDVLALSDEGLHRSSDDGRSWSEAVVPFGRADEGAAQGRRVFVRSGDVLWLSDDAGVTWREIGTPAPGRALRSTAIAGATLYVGAADGLWRSSDSGATWRPVLLGGAQAQHVLTLHVSGSVVYAGLDGGGLWRVDEDAARPLALVRSVPTQAVRADGFDLIATETGVWRRDRSGRTYAPTPISADASERLFAAGGSALYVSADYRDAPALWRTPDGFSWTQLDPPTPVRMLAARDERVAVVGSHSGQVHVSADGGASWDALLYGGDIAQLGYDAQGRLHVLDGLTHALWRLDADGWERVTEDLWPDRPGSPRFALAPQGPVLLSQGSVYAREGDAWRNVTPRGAPVLTRLAPVVRPDGGVVVGFAQSERETLRERSPGGAWTEAVYQDVPVGSASVGPDGTLLVLRGSDLFEER